MTCHFSLSSVSHRACLSNLEHLSLRSFFPRQAARAALLFALVISSLSAFRSHHPATTSRSPSRRPSFVYGQQYHELRDSQSAAARGSVNTYCAPSSRVTIAELATEKATAKCRAGLGIGYEAGGMRGRGKGSLYALRPRLTQKTLRLQTLATLAKTESRLCRFRAQPTASWSLSQAGSLSGDGPRPRLPGIT